MEKSTYGRKYMGTTSVTYIINDQGVIDKVIEKVATKNHADQILKKQPAIKNTPTKKKTAPAKRIVKKVATKKSAVKRKVAKKKK